MKRILTAFLALSVMTAFAGGPEIIAPVDPVISNFNGLYVGLGTGSRQGEFRATSTNQLGIPNDPSPLIFSHAVRSHDGDILGNAFIGFGHSFQMVYLAGEVYGNLNKLQVSSSTLSVIPSGVNVNFTNSVRAHLNNIEGGADLRPGLLVTPSTLLYGRVGVAFNKLYLNPISIGQQIGGPGFINASSSKSKSTANLRIGGGFEQMLGHNFSIRADYIYTDYGRINANGGGTFIDEDQNTATLNSASTMKVTTNTFLFSVAYYFNRLI